MKKRAVSLLLICSLLFGMFSSVSIFAESGLAKPVIDKNTGLGYDTIQEAIVSAASGSVITVASGTYIQDLIIDKDLSIIGEDKNTTVIKGKVSVYGCVFNCSDIKITNNTSTAYGAALITLPVGKPKADATFTNCIITDNDTAFRIENSNSTLTLQNSDVSATAHYGIGLRNINQTLTINGGTVTGWGAIMTSAGSVGNTASSGVKIKIKDAVITGNEDSGGGYYGAIVLQQNFHGVSLDIENSRIIGKGAHMAAMDIRAYDSTINVKNSTLEAMELKYGLPDGEDKTVLYYAPLVLNHGGSEPAGPSTKVVLDNTQIKYTEKNETVGTYPIIKRPQDVVKIDGKTYNVLAGENIQNVIGISKDGDTIAIQEGTYIAPTNSGINVNKKLNLIGIGNVVIKPLGKNHTMEISADGSTIKNIVFDHSTVFGDYNIGVILKAQGVIIDGCSFLLGKNTNNDGNKSGAAIARSGDGTAKTIVQNCTFTAHEDGSWNVLVGGTSPLDFVDNTVNGSFASVFSGLVSNANSKYIIERNNITFSTTSGIVNTLGYAGVFGISNCTPGIFSIHNNVIKNAERLFVISNENRSFGAGDVTNNQFINCEKELVINVATDKVIDLSKNFMSDDGIKGKAPDVFFLSPLNETNVPKMKLMPYYIDSTMATLVDEISGVTMQKTSVELELGKKEQLMATVSPSNAYDKTITWSSNDTSVVTVSNRGMISPVNVGQAIITATAANGKSATCSVKIVAASATVDPIIPGTENKEPIIVSPIKDPDNKLKTDELLEAIKNATQTDSIVVEVTSDDGKDAVISADAISAAVQQSKNNGSTTMVFNIKDKDGKIISSMVLDLTKIKDGENLEINMGFSNTVSPELEKKAKESIPKNANVMFINLSHNGPFPAPMTRMDKVDPNLYKPGNVIYLYWTNDQSGELSEEQRLVLDENGFVTYTISHASSYMLTDIKKVESKPAEKSPDTGDNQYIGLYAILALMGSASILVTGKVKKRK